MIFFLLNGFLNYLTFDLNKKLPTIYVYQLFFERFKKKIKYSIVNDCLIIRAKNKIIVVNNNIRVLTNN